MIHSYSSYECKIKKNVVKYSMNAKQILFRLTNWLMQSEAIV